MTPRFSQYVDPVIEQVIDLMLDADAGRPRSGISEWQRLNVKLQNAERELSAGQDPAWQLAKFALVAWIDESMRSSRDASVREQWLREPLEYKYFKSGESHQWFFVKAKEAANLANGEDAFETYYVCGMLGFRGFYGQEEPENAERTKLVVRQYDLPASFADWARESGQVVRERRKLRGTAASAEQRERRILTAKPFWRFTYVFWPWLSAALLAALNALVAYYRE